MTPTFLTEIEERGCALTLDPVSHVPTRCEMSDMVIHRMAMAPILVVAALKYSLKHHTAQRSQLV